VREWLSGLDDRTTASLLWGAVGGLSFLVLIQGYQLVTAERVAPGVVVAVALAVTAVVAATSRAIGPPAGSERD